jgi:hypothetical protein
MQRDVHNKKSSVVRVTDATSATVPNGITRYGENSAEIQKAIWRRHRLMPAEPRVPLASVVAAESVRGIIIMK